MCKRGYNKRESPEKGVPYLSIFPFNGRPLLAVGPMKIRGAGWCHCLVLFSHPQSSPQPGQKEEGSQA